MLDHFGPVVAELSHNFHPLRVIYCSQCRFRHLVPIPDSSLYTSGAYGRLKSSMLKEHEEDALWWKEIYGDWLTLIDPLTSNRQLLDVGCGSGQFLDAAKTFNFNSIGIEADHALATHRYDTIWTDYIHAENKNLGVISAHWVMEHLSNPIHFLEWARHRLVNGGVLLITLPNDFTSLQEEAALALSRSHYWVDRTHVNYWSALDFPPFIRRHGFDVLYTYGSWEPEYYLMTGQNYLNDPKLGRALHALRKQRDLELTRQQRTKKYLDMGAEGRGRDVTFFCVKK